MKDLKQMINNELVNLLCFGNASEKEKAVIGILTARWSDRNVTQREIAEHSYWVEAMKPEGGNGSIDTIMRDVRRTVRKLRVERKIPILHSSTGYYLPSTQEDMEIFLTRLEMEAKGRAASSMETYRAMKESVGVSSPLFEQLDFVGTQLIRQS